MNTQPTAVQHPVPAEPSAPVTAAILTALALALAALGLLAFHHRDLTGD